MRFWRARHSKLLSRSALHITLFYIESFVRDDLRGLLGVLLLRARAARGFRNGLGILRLGKSNWGKQRYRQRDRQGQAQRDVAQHSATPNEDLSWVNSQDTLAGMQCQSPVAFGVHQ